MSIWDAQFPDITGDDPGYVDHERHLVNQGMVLDFYHVPTGYAISFKGMINSFSDQYTSEWNAESVYGRMDPIAAFQGTARTISIEWDVVASTVREAKLNMTKCETLMAMLYPTYAEDGLSNTIASSPLFKFKFGNFAHDASKGYEAIGARANVAGLTGYISGFTFEPDFEAGIIDGPHPNNPGDTFQKGEFYPQKLTLAAEFTVLHTHNMGWTVGGADSGEPAIAENLGGGTLSLAQSGFPYDTNKAATGIGGAVAGGTTSPGAGGAGTSAAGTPAAAAAAAARAAAGGGGGGGADPDTLDPPDPDETAAAGAGLGLAP